MNAESIEEVSGYFYKSSKNKHQDWKKRWAILQKKDGVLILQKTKTSKDSLKMVDLKQCQPIIEADTFDESLKIRRKTIVIESIGGNADKKYILKTEKVEDHPLWIILLREAQLSRLSKEGYLTKQGKIVTVYIFIFKKIFILIYSALLVINN